MSRLAGSLHKLEKAGALVEDAVMVLLLGSMIFLAAGQILGRNLFNAVYFEGDELLRLMVLWLTLAGAVAASRVDKHIKITVLDRFLSVRIMTFVHVATNLFTASICALIAWHSMRFIHASHEFGDTILGDMPAWALQLVLPVGFGLMAYRHAIHAIRHTFALVRQETPP